MPFLPVTTKDDGRDEPLQDSEDEIEEDPGLNLLKETDSIVTWVRQGKQNIILDRGFRSIQENLENLGLCVYMPAFLNKKSKQHTVQEANDSRLVTKVRWVVEAYHGRFKKFKFLENRQLNSQIPRFEPVLKIVTASLNKHRPPLFDTQKNSELHQSVAKTMLEKSKITSNPMADLVSSGPLSSHGRLWETQSSPGVEITTPSLLPEFPRYSEAELSQLIFCGTYQLKQASHYADEHIRQSGSYEFQVHRQAQGLIRVKIQSRHSNSVQYYSWVKFSTKIEGWYCKCKAGNRVVGCCAHIASIVWFLSFARHNGYRTSPSIDSFWKKVVDSKVGFEEDQE